MIYDETGRKYEVVESIPTGYEVWGAKTLTKQGYIALCKKGDTYDIDTDTLKALKTAGAEAITTAAVLIGDVTKAKAFVKDNFYGQNSYRTKALKEALPFIEALKWGEEKVKLFTVELFKIKGNRDFELIKVKAFTDQEEADRCAAEWNATKQPDERVIVDAAVGKYFEKT